MIQKLVFGSCSVYLILKEIFPYFKIAPYPNAAMAKLVDALDSGSSRGNPVDVRLILAANFNLRDDPWILPHRR